MKVKIEYDSSLNSDEIHLKISPDCANKDNILKILSNEVSSVTARVGEKIYFLNLNDIESFYSLEQSVFALSNNTEYKIKEKLYEIESMFENKNFMRISKSTIINIKMIDYLSPTFNRTLMFKMKSGKTLYSSRSFNTKIKERIGV